jgi:hypothetical protein
MKRIFKFLVVLLAVGALAQTVALAKAKSAGDIEGKTPIKGSDGPGI